MEGYRIGLKRGYGWLQVMDEFVFVKSRILESHVAVVIIIGIVCLEQGPLKQPVGRTDTVFDWLIALTHHAVSYEGCP